jgi:Transglutaminase-like superfamily
MPYERVIDIPKGWTNPRTVQLANGWQGTRLTVSNANALVEDGLTDPLVVATAQNLVRKLPERDQWAEAKAIDSFVKGKIRYTNEGIETIKSPGALLSEIKQYGKAIGDCDDHVILWAALHRALGHPVRFRVISQRPDKLANHIYGEVFIKGRGWIADELIVKNRPLGWAIPKREVTKSVVFMAGLGGPIMRQDIRVAPGYSYYTMGDDRTALVDRGLHRGWRHRHRHRGWVQQRMNMVPGGAQQVVPMSMEIPGLLRPVNSMAPQGYTIKSGGALVQLPSGAAVPISGLGKLKFLSKIGKGLKKLIGGGGKETCPPGYHSDGKGGKGGKGILKIVGKVLPVVALLGTDPCAPGYTLSDVGG